MGAIASQITNLMVVYSTVYSNADQRKHQSSASLAFVRGIHRGPVNSTRKWPVTRKMFPFDDVIMRNRVSIIHWVFSGVVIGCHCGVWCHKVTAWSIFVMTLSNRNVCCVPGLLCGEFTGHRWISLTEASDAELLFFSLICAWTHGWDNHRDPGDLRRHHAHYAVTLMLGDKVAGGS